MDEGGYHIYASFCEAPPLITVEWHDSETPAVGWLVMNSLDSGASGGGTRMKVGGTREEALMLAKTMQIKFAVSGPPVGGAKSVIDFDPDDPRKTEVLRRWFTAIGPYLRNGYGTGGDQGVDEVSEVIPLTREAIALRHPQEGIVVGRRDITPEKRDMIIKNLQDGVEASVPLDDLPDLSLVVADLITGYGLTRALHYYYSAQGSTLAGKRVLLEGFGAVGGPAAYYLKLAGAKIVGIITKSSSTDGFRCCANDDGLDVNTLLRTRENKRHIPMHSKDAADPTVFEEIRADIFVPAATSGTLTLDRLEALRNQGVQVIACGANDPFAESTLGATDVQRYADSRFAVIPDFIANCGMARVFAYLMTDEAAPDNTSVFADVDTTIQQAMNRLVGDGTEPSSGLINRAYKLYVPRPLQ